MSNVLQLSNVTRHYAQGGRDIPVLDGVELTLKAGEMVALVGPSGSGKTTLLQLAGLLDLPDSGKIALAGEDMTRASDNTRTLARRARIGFVYQFHHLLPEFSARENIMMPLLIAGEKESKASDRALELLRIMGLSDRAEHRPAMLSGGEQQRVAIARAVAPRPQLLLADEPTGNLDPATAEEVFRFFVELARKEGVAALVATHNIDLARRMDRALKVQGGSLHSF